MKTNKRPVWIAASIAVLLAVAILSSCDMLFLKFKGSGGATGSIAIVAKWDIGNGISRTLRPGGTSLQIATYAYHLVGPGNVIVDATDSSGTKSFSDLAVGSWTVSISGANSSSVTLLSGTSGFTVSAGLQTRATVNMVAPSGLGSVSLVIGLPAFVTTVTGTIQTEPSGAPSSVNSRLALAANVATYADSLSSGTYRLVLSFRNAQGLRAGTLMEEVDIFAGIATNRTMTITAEALNQVPVAPSVPTTAAGDGQVTLGICSIPGASGYNVYFKAGGSATTADTKAAGSPFSSLSPTISGLSNGTSYSFVVTAINLAGEGAPSVSVTETPISLTVSGVSLNRVSSALLIGGTDQLVATVHPDSAVDKGVSWSSTNLEVATVSENGLVTAKALGTATIYVTTSDQGKSAGCLVSVAPVITTVAGTGSAGFSGDGGQATSAKVMSPFGVAADTHGNIFIADTFNSRVRKVAADGIITTFAGDGSAGPYPSGDGDAAVLASLFDPMDVAVDSGGNVFIADTYNNCIRKVDTGGIITTVAGTGISGFSGDGGAATLAQLSCPYGVAVDAAGNLFISDLLNNRIRKVDASGIITTMAGNGVQGFSGDGGSAISAELYFPFGIDVDSSGNIYFSDSDNERVRKVSPGGIITTIAGDGTAGYLGDGGPGTSARLDSPNGLSVDSLGNVYVADEGNSRIRAIAPSGIITTIAGSESAGFSGDGGPSTAAGLRQPGGVAADRLGNLYIADTYDYRIRKLSSINGFIDTGSTGSISGTVKDALSNSGVAGVSIVAYSGSTLLGTATTGANGSFFLRVAAGNLLRVSFQKSGYVDAAYHGVDVIADTTTYLETVLQVANAYSGPGTIGGIISDAFDGQGVSGASLSLRSGIGSSSGTILCATTTDSSGAFFISSVSGGNYTAEVKKDGYTTAYYSIVAVGDQTVPNQNASITPLLGGQETRFVLTWGANPSDLDSHLRVPDGSGGYYHVYFESKGNAASEPWATLDTDDTTSYGPETITISTDQTGDYFYYVHDFSNRGSASSLALGDSGAQVKVYMGASLVATYNVPAGGGTLWKVCRLNGTTLTPINAMLYESDGANVAARGLKGSLGGRMNAKEKRLFIDLPSKH
jgi:sugar lactone lactonase YvrE